MKEEIPCFCQKGWKQTNKQTKNVGFVIGIFPKFWGAPTPKNTFSTKATRAHDPKSKWCESYQIYSRLTKHNWIYRTNHLRCINDCKQWDVYLISTGKRSISEPSVQYYPLFTARCCAAPGLSPCTNCRCSKNTRGSSEKTTETITWYFLFFCCVSKVFFCWGSFFKVAHIFFWGDGKKVKFFGVIFGFSSFATGFTTKVLFPRALWKDATKKPIRSTEEEPEKRRNVGRYTTEKHLT